MEGFDVAVIGAGPEGLVAATLLARNGYRVVLLEKNAEAGGRLTMTEFHPGFKAALYADELPLVPARLFQALDLARHGSVLIPYSSSVCLSADGVSQLFRDGERSRHAIPADSREGYHELQDAIERARQAIAARAARLAPGRSKGFFRTQPRPSPWPAEGWWLDSLEEILGRHIPSPLVRLHLMADVLSGRAASPFLAGTGLHLLAPASGRSGRPPNGFGRLAAALRAVAEKAGVTVFCNDPVIAIQVENRQIRRVITSYGVEISVKAAISALDVKRTMALVATEVLSAADRSRVYRYRMSAQSARVLFALDRWPDFSLKCASPQLGLGAIHVVESAEALALGYDAWRRGAFPVRPLVTLRFPSLSDPSLVPAGKALMTATISAVPAALMGGAWDDEKRQRLASLALAAAERAAAGVSGTVLGHRTVIAADVESSLSLSNGDLEGGELAPDQALGFRPFGHPSWQEGRTPIGGLYLAGPSAAPSPFLLGLSGERAARATLADLGSGILG